MAEEDRITLVIEGFPEDDGRVRLAAFMSQIQNLNATVAKLDREAHDGKSASYFQIAELSFSSPVRISVEPHALAKRPYVGSAIVESLERITTALDLDADLSGFDADLLEDIRALARPVGKSVKSAALVFNGESFDLTERVTARVDEALAVDDECEGALEGRLEQINLHHGANVFHIYPDVGPKKVSCHFPAKLYDEAVSAVGRRAEIFGTLHYRSGANFPHKISVASIEAYPPDDELPDWEDLRGRAPNATEGLSSEAFVRELRNGWR
ncbi:MAG: hypothetical protein ACPW61_00715 [Methyloligella sp. ZOD6]